MVTAPSCPVARSLNVVGDRWSLMVMRDAFDGMRRFSEFQRSLGVARNILSNRLHALTAEGLLALAPASDGSAYQEYVLTPKGEAFFPIIVALRQWGEGNLFEKGEAHSRLLTRDAGKPLATLEPRTRDGQRVSWRDTQVVRPAASSAPKRK